MIESTEDVLKKAMKENDYSYDIYFRMSVIDDYLKGNEDIWDLYNRMQYTRCSRNPNIPAHMIDNRNNFIDLINSIKENGYDNDNPIIVNKEGLIIDGAHRMSCCLYFDIPKISTLCNSKSENFIPDDYSKEWFLNNNLSECISYAEKQKMKVKKKYHV